MREAIVLILSYLVGSIPFAYIFTRLWTGTDIREKGSGNVGSTNVLRTVGKGVALAAFAGDLLKGVFAAWIGFNYGGYNLAAVCSVAAVIGHCWPVFLGFRGGKGVATSAGIVLFLAPQVFAVLIILFIIIVALSRYVSLGSVLIAALLPLALFLFHKPSAIILMSLIMALLVIFRHRENIKRLSNGTEGKIGKKQD